MTDELRWINGDLLHCSFCGRSQGECAKLVAGYLVYICDRCVARAGGRPAVTDPGRACSFCGKAASTVGRMVAEKTTAICDQCLELCAEIIEEEQAG